MWRVWGVGRAMPVQMMIAGLCEQGAETAAAYRSWCRYGLWGSSPMPFSSVAEMVRAKGETAIG